MQELTSISVKTVLLVAILLVTGFSRSTRGTQVSADCSSPPETGPCRGLFPKFYYDKSSKSCKGFTYGGCDGNGNRYDTKADCEAKCRGFDGGDL